MASTISTTGTGSLSSAGIGSGLDVNSIVTQLMAIEKQPLTTLQTKAATIQSTVSEYGKIKSAVSALNDLAVKLASKATWAQTTASSTDTAVSAVTNGSTAGTYTVEVTSLASVQTLASSAKAATDPAGAGNLHIDLGTWTTASDGSQSFAAAPAPSTGLDVTVSATDTLADVRDKINALGGGVSAAIMSDASGARLLIRSNATGASNGFRTTVSNAIANPDGSSLASLAYDPQSGISNMTRSQTAANAVATVNGLPVSSASNTLTNVVDGLTLTLNGPTTNPVTVNVAVDTASLKKTITDFAAAYTAVYKEIAADTKYDATTKTGGILQGDSAAVGLQTQLRALAGGISGASSAFARLSDAGLQIQADGSLTVDSTKIDSALANITETTKLFANSSDTDPTQDGFAKRFRVATDAMLAIDGSLSTRTTGLGDQLTRNQKDQDTLNTRLADIEKRLRAQYTALDTQMAAFSTQSSYITQQIASWNANKS